MTRQNTAAEVKRAADSAALYVDHAIRTVNRLLDMGICDALTVEQAAWLGVLRGDLAMARDALASVDYREQQEQAS